MTTALEAALAHYKSLGTQSMVVPEWGNLTVYWTPLTPADSDKFVKIGDDGKTTAILLDIVIGKALDAAGKRLFDLDAKQKLRVAADQTVISRIARAMLSSPSVEEAEKN